MVQSENPFDLLTDVNGTGSQEGDIILAHSTSVFTGESIRHPQGRPASAWRRQ